MQGGPRALSDKKVGQSGGERRIRAPECVSLVLYLGLPHFQRNIRQVPDQLGASSRKDLQGS